jgi:hypothetical protein
LIDALDIASCDCWFVGDSEDRSDPNLKLVEVPYLFVNFLRRVALVVLQHEWFNLFKSLSTHKAGGEGDLLNVRYLFSLEYKEEILLHKPVIKLRALSIIQIRLVNIDGGHIVCSRWRVGYVNIRGARAARGSTGS